MRRIYFLIPNTVIAGAIVDELLLERVEERHIQIVAKTGTPLGELPEASVLESSDFYPALEQGIALGGVTGLLSGLVAVAVPTGLVLGGGAVLAITLAGAGVAGSCPAWWASAPIAGESRIISPPSIVANCY